MIYDKYKFDITVTSRYLRIDTTLKSDKMYFTIQ